MDAAAVCMRELVAVPAFVASFEREIGRGLEAGERECVSGVFLGADDEVIAAVEGEGLGLVVDVGLVERFRREVDGCVG